MSKRNVAYVPLFKTKRTPSVYQVTVLIATEGFLKTLGTIDMIERIAPIRQLYEAEDIPESTAFFCPHCGKIWGRLIIHHPNVSAPLWTTLERACRSCGDGSIEPYLGGRHDEIMELFNTDLWIREFEIELEYPENKEFLEKHGIIEHNV